jgi:hypothetical protein
MGAQPIMKARFQEFQAWKTTFIFHIAQNKDNVIVSFNKFEIFK